MHCVERKDYSVFKYCFGFGLGFFSFQFAWGFGSLWIPKDSFWPVDSTPHIMLLAPLVSYGKDRVSLELGGSFLMKPLVQDVPCEKFKVFEQKRKHDPEWTPRVLYSLLYVELSYSIKNTLLVHPGVSAGQPCFQLKTQAGHVQLSTAECKWRHNNAFAKIFSCTGLC